MVLSIMLGDSGGMFAEVPEFLKPAARLSPIKHGFDGCTSAEFKGLEFKCDDLDDLVAEGGGGEAARGILKGRGRGLQDAFCLRNGAQVLKSLGLGERSVASAAKEQARLICFNLGLTYFLLNLKDKASGRQLGSSHSSNPPIPFDDCPSG